MGCSYILPEKDFNIAAVFFLLLSAGHSDILPETK